MWLQKRAYEPICTFQIVCCAECDVQNGSRSMAEHFRILDSQSAIWSDFGTPSLENDVYIDFEQIVTKFCSHSCRIWDVTVETCFCILLTWATSSFWKNDYFDIRQLADIIQWVIDEVATIGALISCLTLKLSDLTFLSWDGPLTCQASNNRKIGFSHLKIMSKTIIYDKEWSMRKVFGVTCRSSIFGLKWPIDQHVGTFFGAW